MRTLKKGFIIFLAVFIVLSFSITTSLADSSMLDKSDIHELCCSFYTKGDQPIFHDDLFHFGRLSYYKNLFEIEYDFRLLYSLESEIKNIVILDLARDGVLPTLANGEINHALIDLFISRNVHIEIVGNEEENSIMSSNPCCGAGQKIWVPAVAGRRVDSNNICTRHCSHDFLRCANSNCNARLGIRDVILSKNGCGRHRTNCTFPAHITCSVAH